MMATAKRLYTLWQMVRPDEAKIRTDVGTWSPSTTAEASVTRSAVQQTTFQVFARLSLSCLYRSQKGCPVPCTGGRGDQTVQGISAAAYSGAPNSVPISVIRLMINQGVLECLPGPCSFHAVVRKPAAEFLCACPTTRHIVACPVNHCDKIAPQTLQKPNKSGTKASCKLASQRLSPLGNPLPPGSVTAVQCPVCCMTCSLIKGSHCMGGP